MELNTEERMGMLLGILGENAAWSPQPDVANPYSESRQFTTLHSFPGHPEKQPVGKKAKTQKPSDHMPPTSAELNPAKAGQLLSEQYSQYKHLECGGSLDTGETFTHWDLIQLYPQMYIGKTNRIKAAVSFENVLEGIIWDFFYLFNPQKLSKPKLFVPTQQFVRFLEIVNAKLGIQLTIPPEAPGEKFRLSFEAGGITPPRYLGRTASKTQFKALVETLPQADETDMCLGASSIGIEDLVRKLDVALLTKDDDKKKQKSAKKRLLKINLMKRDLKLVQRYLGIVPEQDSVFNRKGQVIRLDLDKPLPHTQFCDVVFVAIDVEVAEMTPSIILEVGISVLDSRDTAAIAPGDKGFQWFPMIKSYHLHTYDYRFQRNYKFVHGCPEAFHFGESRQPQKAELKDSILRIIQESLKQNDVIAGEDEASRSFVFVGHDIEADIKYLHSMDFDLKDINGFLGCIDTKDIHRLYRELPNGSSLANVLNDLQISHSDLHNAGNDAAYTMQAMLSLAIATRLDHVQTMEELERVRDQEFRKNILECEEESMNSPGSDTAASVTLAK